MDAGNIMCPSGDRSNLTDLFCEHLLQVVVCSCYVFLHYCSKTEIFASAGNPSEAWLKIIQLPRL